VAGRAPPGRRSGAPAGAADRLDARVVEAGLAPTRSQAEALIRAGRILVDDEPVEKPGARVRPGASLRLRGEARRFASRGGEKLAGALADLGLDPSGLRCLDVGASTGGFTDCLLQAGAREVVAVDVGYGQLDARLRADPRVRLLERCNARHLDAAALAGPVALATVDVSFISVRLLLPRLAAIAPQAELLVLVKPQFEVGRGRVGKGGVVRDDALRAEAVRGVREAAEALGYTVVGQVDSRLPGPKGNREIFLWLRPPVPV
jgi:23S rRNA (cytidine1920-2'-O)/16S rRNA (cytidine1409-2'-O)-methyltransferase